MNAQLTTDVLRDPHQLCTAERGPQALLAKAPPGLEAKVERAFRKLCEALSIAEGSSGPLGGWAHRDPDRVHWRRTSMKKRQKSEALRVAQETAESKLKEKLWAAA